MPLAHCTLKVKGLDCPVEAKVLSEALENADGVHSLGFDLILGTMTVGYDPDRLDPEGLIARVESLAKMKAELLTRSSPKRELDRRLIPVGAGLCLLIATCLERLTPYHLVGKAFLVLAVAVGGVELLPKAWAGLRRRKADIHVLMAFAIVGAFLVGEWDEAATISFLFALSEALESFSLSRARKAVHRLIDAMPSEAELLDDGGGSRTVPSDSLKRGDRVRVRPGAIVPADGIVLLGMSSVDAKAVTGESVPIPREPGDAVSAGSVNGDGTLEIEATSDARDSVVARIAKQVKEAQARRAPIEKSIERFAAWYTPAVLAISIGVMLLPPIGLRLLSREASFRDWFNRGLVVLVASCPCALVVSTPVAIASAVAAAGRRGILLRGGPFLEEFGRLKAIAFDKTGTLTLGEPSVVDVVARNIAEGGLTLLQIAAALGEQGGHVLGRAISRHAREREVVVPLAVAYRAVPGLGATATVDSVEYFMGSHRYLDESGLCRPDFHQDLGEAERDHGTAVALSGTAGPLGWIRLSDSLRPEAAEVLEDLRSLGIHTAMLTGDNPKAAAAVGARLGLDETHASLLPEEKARLVADMIERRGSTGMVGDGVNDAPALAASRVSVVLGDTATGTAMNAADVVLLSRDLKDLPWLVRQGRKTIRCIHTNIALALSVKAAVIVVAALGLVVGPPALWLAVLADVGTTVLVTANALRLLR